MKRIVCLLTFMACLAGCKSPQPAATGTSDTPVSAPTPNPTSPTAANPRITMVHSEQRFVVIDFSTQAMPAIGKRLTVYREGKNRGEVQLTEPVRARFATADIITGEPRIGDEVR